MQNSWDSNAQDLTSFGGKTHALLCELNCPPRRLGPVLSLAHTAALKLLPPANTEVSLDWETRGLDVSAPDFKVIGVGLAWEEPWRENTSIYFDLRDTDDSCLVSLVRHIHTLRPVAHNVIFDGAVLAQLNQRFELAQVWPWVACTFALWQQLGPEGHPGQRWSLKHGMKLLLGWSDTNEAELDQWLIDRGYFTWSRPKGKPAVKSPAKSEMWRAPAHVLGRYCVLDAEATWLLWTQVLKPKLTQFPVLDRLHRHHTQRVFSLLVRQQLRGVQIDVDRLRNYYEEVKRKIQDRYYEWLALPEVARELEAYDRDKFAQLWATQPPRYKKRKLGREPPQFTRTGRVSKNWLKWQAKAAQPPEERKDWHTWLQKFDALAEKPTLFNPNSDKQLRWLLYERLKFPVLLWTKGSKESEPQPAVSDKALSGLGPVGKKLIAYHDVCTELRYVEACLQNVDSAGILRPKFKFGTITGRLKGGLDERQ